MKNMDQQVLGVVLNSIGQEIRLSGGSCRDFGRAMGEKVAEEAAMRGVLTGLESSQEFTRAFFSKVFPIFFSGCPEISDNAEAQKLTVDISALQGLASACRPGILADFAIGLVWGASFRVLGSPVVMARAGKGLKLVASYRSPRHLYDTVGDGTNRCDGTEAKIMQPTQIKEAPGKKKWTQ